MALSDEAVEQLPGELAEFFVKQSAQTPGLPIPDDAWRKDAGKDPALWVDKDHQFAELSSSDSFHPPPPDLAASLSVGLKPPEPPLALPAKTNSIPKHIGKYEIVSEIGFGGSGTVYKAKDPDMGREVAIKTIANAAPELRRRFLAEASAGLALTHPNIVTVYEIGELDNTGFIVMELLDGVSLDRILASGGTQLIWTEKLNIMIQLCNGLEYAHSRGVIHRDIKPANIVVQFNHQVKIIDFGIARLDSAPADAFTSMIVGTFGYISPERLNGEQGDGRVDIWAVGVIIYQMITGSLPFPGDGLSAMYKIVNEPFEPISRFLSRELPTDLIEKILTRALAKNPENRYLHAREMAADFTNAQKYDRVRAAGIALEDRETLVEALTLPTAPVDTLAQLPDASGGFTRTPDGLEPSSAPSRKLLDEADASLSKGPELNRTLFVKDSPATVSPEIGFTQMLRLLGEPAAQLRAPELLGASMPGDATTAEPGEGPLQPDRTSPSAADLAPVEKAVLSFTSGKPAGPVMPPSATPISHSTPLEGEFTRLVQALGTHTSSYPVSVFSPTPSIAIPIDCASEAIVVIDIVQATATSDLFGWYSVGRHSVRHLRQTVREIGELYGLACMKSTGDGLLLTYRDDKAADLAAVNAVQASLDLLKRLSARNETAPEERQIAIRLALHFGEVDVLPDDREGPNVSFTFRVEAINHASLDKALNPIDPALLPLRDYILCSERIHDIVDRRKPEWRKTSCGLFKLKGFTSWHELFLVSEQPRPNA